MFDRLKKPFMTVETGEAYQPLRLTYDLINKDQLVANLNKLKCLTHNPNGYSWDWYWKAESDDMHFESLDSFKKNPEHPVRLGSLFIKNDLFYISLPSFKRACLAVPFFHQVINHEHAKVHHADFINKVFGVDEKLPQGFADLFKENELQAILNERVANYEKMQELCEHAGSAEEALQILRDYTDTESKKKLPYAERYEFEFKDMADPEVLFLSFYIFLRGRELVAIKRWFGESSYTLADAADETIQQVFGDVGIDIIE